MSKYELQKIVQSTIRRMVQAADRLRLVPACKWHEQGTFRRRGTCSFLREPLALRAPREETIAQFADYRFVQKGNGQ